MRSKINEYQSILEGEGSVFSSKFDPVSGISDFQQLVLDYYHQHGRPMAWRDTTDPYRILVSEIMLQQTQVERVFVKYAEFLAAFPDFAALAQAPLAEILAVWQGMGYNRRAISLQKCAQRVMQEYGGELPADVDTLATFPGIGRATASSICAFAFNMPVIFIETNIRRVFIHFFFPDNEIIPDTDIVPLVERSLFRKNPRCWYWALMDLGTALKNTVPNPNRRSAHYTKQSPFEGSDRKIRGLILKHLLIIPGAEEKEILEVAGGEGNRVRRIICSLIDEGFITLRDGRYSLAR
jgi:A/G-specific adenine glycosylase